MIPIPIQNYHRHFNHLLSESKKTWLPFVIYLLVYCSCISKYLNETNKRPSSVIILLPKNAKNKFIVCCSFWCRVGLFSSVLRIFMGHNQKGDAYNNCINLMKKTIKDIEKLSEGSVKWAKTGLYYAFLPITVNWESFTGASPQV